MEVHPIAIAYMLSCVSIYLSPLLALRGESGNACESLASTHFVWVASFFVNAVAHIFYALWMLERSVAFSTAEGAPGVGDALARHSSIKSWAAFFGARAGIAGSVCAIVAAVETGCDPHYLQLAACSLVADSLFALLAFAGSWSLDRLREGEKNREADEKKKE